MTDFETLLKILEKKDENFVHKRLYRNLCNPEIYTYFNKTEELKDGSFRPDRSQNKEDVELFTKVLDILDAVFSPVLKNSSMTPHRALQRITMWGSYETILTLNLNSLITCINNKILETILREKIKDSRFIQLSQKFFSSGYFNRLDYKELKLTEKRIAVYYTPIIRFLEELRNKGLIDYVFCQNRLAVLVKDMNFKKQFISSFNKLISKTYGTGDFNLTQAGESFEFLGYEFRRIGSKIIARVPQRRLTEIIRDKGLVKNISDKPWKPIHRSYLLNKPDSQIIKVYSSELKSTYLYYSLCENVSQKIGQLKHVMETSCLKTLAMKHRTSVRNIKEKLKMGNTFGITENGKTVKFYKGFKRRFDPID